jgi:stage III sporulation protein AA
VLDDDLPFDYLFIDKLEDCLLTIRSILQKGRKIVAFDCQSTSKGISIIQLAIRDDSVPRQAYLFDIQTVPTMLIALEPILTSNEIIKIVHDARQEYHDLLSKYYITLTNIFDTQVAYQILHKTDVCIELNQILQTYTEVETATNRNPWEGHLLTSANQFYYCAEKVVHLLDAFEAMENRVNINMILHFSLTRCHLVQVETPSCSAYGDDEEQDNQEEEEEEEYSSRVSLFDSNAEMDEEKQGSVETTMFPPPGLLLRARSEKELDKLINILPERIQLAYQSELDENANKVIEFVFDIGRKPSVSLRLDSTVRRFPKDLVSCSEITREDIDQIVSRLGEFTSDNRCGLDGTLHRISRKVNKQGIPIALTIRVGRMIQGSTQLITDLIKTRKSVLLIGMPGVGKTTLLREYARVLASETEGVRVEVVDTSNEIAGEGDIPHASIGRARRMMVSDRKVQHMTMIEAVQNHTPECLIVDEIGTKEEARACCDITQRGVQLVGTAHGTDLQQLLENPELNILLGGVHSVILGDEERARRNLRTKTVLERKGPCAFDCAIELRSLHCWIVYQNLPDTIDTLLQSADKLDEMIIEVRRVNPQNHEMTIEKILKKDFEK